MTNSNNSSGGIGFAGILAIAFIILKLCNVISWKWIWVLSPIWIASSIVIVFLIVDVIIVSLRK